MQKLDSTCFLSSLVIIEAESHTFACAIVMLGTIFQSLFTTQLRSLLHLQIVNE